MYVRNKHLVTSTYIYWMTSNFNIVVTIAVFHYNTKEILKSFVHCTSYIHEQFCAKYSYTFANHCTCTGRNDFFRKQINMCKNFILQYSRFIFHEESLFAQLYYCSLWYLNVAIYDVSILSGLSKMILPFLAWNGVR